MYMVHLIYNPKRPSSVWTYRALCCARDRLALSPRANPQPQDLGSRGSNIGALMVRIGFWGPILLIIIIRNPPNIVLVVI